MEDLGDFLLLFCYLGDLSDSVGSNSNSRTDVNHLLDDLDNSGLKANQRCSAKNRCVIDQPTF